MVIYFEWLTDLEWAIRKSCGHMCKEFDSTNLHSIPSIPWSGEVYGRYHTAQITLQKNMTRKCAKMAQITSSRGLYRLWRNVIKFRFSGEGFILLKVYEFHLLQRAQSAEND